MSASLGLLSISSASADAAAVAAPPQPRAGKAGQGSQHDPNLDLFPPLPGLLWPFSNWHSRNFQNWVP